MKENQPKDEGIGDESPVKRDTGLHNWKNLFKRPTTDQWIIFVILLMLLFSAWAYYEDTKQAREVLSNIDNVCMAWNEQHLKRGFNQTDWVLNLTKIEELS